MCDQAPRAQFQSSRGLGDLTCDSRSPVVSKQVLWKGWGGGGQSYGVQAERGKYLGVKSSAGAKSGLEAPKCGGGSECIPLSRVRHAPWRSHAACLLRQKTARDRQTWLMRCYFTLESAEHVKVTTDGWWVRIWKEAVTCVMLPSWCSSGGIEPSHRVADNPVAIRTTYPLSTSLFPAHQSALIYHLTLP